MHVYVLLFNVGTANEGIHTLLRKDDGRNVVLMFESEDDATRYGLMLEAQDFMSPAVEAIESEEVEEFCRDADYDWVMVPEGMLTVPPEENVTEMEWDPDAERSPNPEPAAEFSSTDLDAIRQRLEGLL